MNIAYHQFLSGTATSPCSDGQLIVHGVATKASFVVVYGDVSAMLDAAARLPLSRAESRSWLIENRKYILTAVPDLRLRSKPKKGE